MKKAFIFLSGELKGGREYYRGLIGDTPIYCADGGAVYADSLGLIPREIWGDMDSINGELLRTFKEKGSRIKRFSPYKDFTDGELILEYVTSKGYEDILVVGATGGRTDHYLTNINLLFKFPKVRFITEEEEILTVDKDMELSYNSGTTVSFVPFSDKVEGLTLEGFKYPLEDFTLKRGDSICMSNVITEEARIRFKKGRLICIIQK